MKQLSAFLSNLIELFADTLKEVKNHVSAKLWNNLFLDMIALLLITVIISLPDILSNLPYYKNIGIHDAFALINLDHYKGLGTGFSIAIFWIYGKNILDKTYLKDKLLKSRSSFNALAILFMFTMIITAIVYKINASPSESLGGFMNQFDPMEHLKSKLTGLWGLASFVAGYLTICILSESFFNRVKFMHNLNGLLLVMLVFDFYQLIVTNLKFYLLDPVSALMNHILGQSMVSIIIYMAIYLLMVLVIFKVTCISLVVLMDKIKSKWEQYSIQNIP